MAFCLVLPIFRLITLAILHLLVIQIWIIGSVIMHYFHNRWKSGTRRNYSSKSMFIAAAGRPTSEASVQCVSSTHQKSGIHFGSFNHNRKLSDQILSLWGRILSAHHESRLVLKANNSDDPNTMELLKPE